MRSLYHMARSYDYCCRLRPPQHCRRLGELQFVQLMQTLMLPVLRVQRIMAH